MIRPPFEDDEFLFSFLDAVSTDGIAALHATCRAVRGRVARYAARCLPGSALSWSAPCYAVQLSRARRVALRRNRTVAAGFFSPQKKSALATSRDGDLYGPDVDDLFTLWGLQQQQQQPPLVVKQHHEEETGPSAADTRDPPGDPPADDDDDEEEEEIVDVTTYAPGSSPGGCRRRRRRRRGNDNELGQQLLAASKRACRRRPPGGGVLLQGELNPRPGAPPRVPVKIAQVATGPRHAVALCAVGEAYAWGCNASGQLGLGEAFAQYAVVATPRRVAALGRRRRASCRCFGADVSSHGAARPPTSSWSPTVEVACGEAHTIFLASDGRARSCGAPRAAGLGKLVAVDRVDAPTLLWRLADRGVRIVRVAAHGHHSLALSSEGDCFSWGAVGAGGRLGHGDDEPRREPTLVRSLCGERIAEIACGPSTSMALALHPRRLYWWGLDDDLLSSSASSASKFVALATQSTSRPQGTTNHYRCPPSPAWGAPATSDAQNPETDPAAARPFSNVLDAVNPTATDAWRRPTLCPGALPEGDGPDDPLPAMVALGGGLGAVVVSRRDGTAYHLARRVDRAGRTAVRRTRLDLPRPCVAAASAEDHLVCALDDGTLLVSAPVAPATTTGSSAAP